jgi:hypothetical protein
MVDITTIGGALASLKAAKDIAEAMVGLRDATAFEAKRFELQRKLLEAQEGVFAANQERAALIERVGELEKEVAGLKTWDREKERYQLAQVGPGVLAYALKPDIQGTEPFHLLCARCYAEGKKAILQATRRLENGYRIHKCLGCKSELAYPLKGEKPSDGVVFGAA